MPGTDDSSQIFLITGASGFLGGALALRLATLGLRTRILVRNPLQADRFSHPGLETAFGHLGDTASLAHAVTGVTTVVHCAAASTDWAPWPVYEAGNVTGVDNLLKATIAAGSVQRFVHISTTDVYGYPIDPHVDGLPLTDVGLPYNRSKILGEQAVWKAAADAGLPVTVLRPATIYGPGSKDFVVTIAEMLRLHLMLLIDGGRAPAGFLYIDNAVDAILAAAQSPSTVNNAYDLRDETAETWRDYVFELARLLGVSGPWLNLPFNVAYPFAGVTEQLHSALRLPGKPLLTRHAVYLMSRAADFPIERARNDFGFTSRVTFAEGVARSAAWLQQQRA